MTDIPFATPDLSWEQYLEHRPAYPGSLWKLILDYHDGPLLQAHDIGAGNGISTHGLAHFAASQGAPIPRLTVSDPGRDNIRAAVEALVLRGDGSYSSTSVFGFKLAKAEELVLQPPGSVDLTMACESLHWTQVSEAIELVGKSLRQGGTLCAVFYHIYPTISNSTRAAEAFARVLEEHYKLVFAKKALSNMLIQGHRNVSVGLDYVPLVNDIWADVRRIEINTSAHGGKWPWPEACHRLYGKPESMVPKGCEKEKWDDVEGWSKRCPVSWLKGNLESLASSFNELTWQSEAWRELEQVVHDEVGGELELIWPVAVVLARKK